MLHPQTKISYRARRSGGAGTQGKADMIRTGITRRQFATGLAGSAAMAGIYPPFARAQQNYPNRPVRFILPFGAAGVADITSRLAAEKLTTADRESIEELLVQLQGRVTDQRDLMQLDQRIHRLVYRCSHNPFLEATLERYFNLSLRLWYLVLDREVRLREAVDEHVDLLRAILAGDGARAEDTMREHVTGFEREIRKVLVEG